ncbi:uncharacterized protein BDV14DRAFT_171542 [Aspergillus stella-maris]|uniref:uncharacterized protein n=1 Tax=Aspergillus stella-maris TaxID=1810926 RepID=UPI003CCE1EE9
MSLFLSPEVLWSMEPAYYVQMRETVRSTEECGRSAWAGEEWVRRGRVRNKNGEPGTYKSPGCTDWLEVLKGERSGFCWCSLCRVSSLQRSQTIKIGYLSQPMPSQAKMHQPGFALSLRCSFNFNTAAGIFGKSQGPAWGHARLQSEQCHR